ncbi:hypothetical protein WOLCODRAFT_88179 [Wolfiporia cocos MD-104 SS10]|uniref:P-loop containing nucleoside triphosphate hydrolase protein n=1 Tax=Wolfiporia cocos (strain MD-104) TaxID=742152 RepID=A0A2H3J8Q3_WOLCO|nr:hypothetical protein WOLCODRAFT_88179 [Wolfiporia cocos MD-104 SS10]
MTINLNEVSEILLPRRYQEEIFSRARRSNVIAALDTGSGKTYISTLLIRWITTKDLSAGKIIVFLVPKVALVEQQGDFIARQTPLRVSKCCGATAVDLADRTGWKKELEGSDVLVMTAQIFLNILTHSHWSLDKVSLMVFDECHHTRKNHAYNGIMREYFQLPAGKRPKVFGMTASPIWNPKDAVQSLATLETNLDAKVIAVREHVSELLDHSPRPEEEVHEYPAPLDSYPAYPPQTLWVRLNLMGLPPTADIPVDKIRTRYEVTYASLGPYGAELYLYNDIKQRVTQIVNQYSNNELELFTINFDGPEIPRMPVIELPPHIEDLQDALTEYKSLFEDEKNPDIVPITVHLRWCSPKVRALIDILFAHYTADFQGIVFVEQRHVAACLSMMLPRVPQLSHLIRSGQLIGHGATTLAKSQVRGMALRTQQDIVRLFREKQINLLIATSVAEEGLDFPACDVVVRFDPLQHMVGYLQSRGRARHKTSRFIVMVQQGHLTHIERYRAFYESEPQLRRVYQTRDAEDGQTINEDDEKEEKDHPADLAERERYVVPKTGAVLTYNSAIGLLNHLCSLIPHDKFTPMHLPRYSGDFVSTLQLPSSLPLPHRDLIYIGPEKRSKKEAKRAVAFKAVVRLHALGVFDDFLLPAQSGPGGYEDADGRSIRDLSKIPDTLQVQVCDPWTRGAKQWLHIVYLDGHPVAGLVTGTPLPAVELACQKAYVSSGEAQLVRFDSAQEWRQRRQMEDYMRMGLWWCITGRGIALPLTCYLLPITHDLQIDWAAVARGVAHPYGTSDWAPIGEQHYHHTLAICSREPGRPFILHSIRKDLSPMSVPPPGSREAEFPTYRDFWIHKFTRKENVPEIPPNGPCIEGQPLHRHTASTYSLEGDIGQPSAAAPPILLYPLCLCRRTEISEEMYRAFHALPELCHRITDIYRARCARMGLSLPPIVDDVMVQALTLPSANAGFNNQRLETLGDAVLKVSTVVHLFNRYPYRHEGQLDMLRRTAVSNRTLMARALEHGMERYLTSESQSMRVWRYTLPPEGDLTSDEPCRQVERAYPRRSLQDCMEATLGASFATGGVDMALRAGTALGLCFGGPLPWSIRYGGRYPESSASSLFTTLQETMGYKFRYGQLLLEAVTHPSFGSWDSPSYQRLEFLGDAFLDLVVMRYLYEKFPKATSGQLSWARSRAVCAPALAAVAVKRLSLHKLLLINNVELSVAISKYIPILQALSDEEIVNHAWKQDPPKAISDVLESVLGAVLVDCDYQFERAASVAELVMHDVLLVLSPDLPKDPVSELMVWSGQSGCRKISFRKTASRPETKRNDSISVIVHEQSIVGPITAPNLSMAKGLAAERARFILSHPDHMHHLSRICDCPKKENTKPKVDESVADDVAAATVPAVADADVEPDAAEFDDETAEGFAHLAMKFAEEYSEEVKPESTNDDDFVDESEDMMDDEILSDVEDKMNVDESPPEAFLNQLRSLYSSHVAATPDIILAQPWYLIAAVAFSASRKTEAVPVVFEFVMSELKLAQIGEQPERALAQRMTLANKMREALLQSGQLTGMPRVIESLIALRGIMPEELRPKQVLRDRTKTIADYEESGERLFRAMYRDTKDSVQALLDSAYPDLGWYCNTVGYGITYGGTDILTQVETSYVVVAALIAVDAPRQIVWHLANAQNGGATLEEARAVREIAMKVAEVSGVKWENGVPEV